MLHQCVLDKLQATQLGGHFGRNKTLALVRLMVWWPHMAAQVVEFIDSSPTCQRVKAEHGLQAGLLYPLLVPVRSSWMILLSSLLQSQVMTSCRCTLTCSLVWYGWSPRLSSPRQKQQHITSLVQCFGTWAC